MTTERRRTLILTSAMTVVLYLMWGRNSLPDA